MSLDAMLGEDFMSVTSPATTKDASGAPKYNYATATPRLTGVPCRHEWDSANQQDVFGEWQQVVIHTFFTQESSIRNGDIITDSSGRVIRVTGTPQWMQMGGIDSYWEVKGTELKPI